MKPWVHAPVPEEKKNHHTYGNFIPGMATDNNQYKSVRPIIN
jgi:hypothetical protein